MKLLIPLERHVDPEPSRGWLVLLLVLLATTGAIVAAIPMGPR